MVYLLACLGIIQGKLFKGNLLTWRKTFLGTPSSRRICDRSKWSSR
jgi:hypothetical protein